nr:uncharacterized protein LOC109173926 [Ipomoea batatas]
MPPKRSQSTAVVAHRTRSKLAAATAAARPPLPPASVARRLQFEAMSSHCPAATNDRSSSPYPSSAGDQPPSSPSVVDQPQLKPSALRTDAPVCRGPMENSSAENNRSQNQPQPKPTVRLPQYAGKGLLHPPSPQHIFTTESSYFICQKKIVISDFTAKTGLIGKFKSCQLFTSVVTIDQFVKPVVHEFYANLAPELVCHNRVYIRGRLFDFGPDSINHYFWSADYDDEFVEDMDQITAKLTGGGFTKLDTEDYEAQSLPIKVDPRLLNETHIDDLGAPEVSRHQPWSFYDGAAVDTIQILEEELVAIHDEQNLQKLKQHKQPPKLKCLLDNPHQSFQDKTYQPSLGMTLNLSLK